MFEELVEWIFVLKFIIILRYKLFNCVHHVNKTNLLGHTSFKKKKPLTSSSYIM